MYAPQSTHVSATHVLHLYFYIYSTCVGHVPVFFTGVLHMYYKCVAHIVQVYELQEA